MKTPTIKRNRKPYLQLLHQYYSYTGFYPFILSSLKKVVLPVVGIAAVLIFLEYYVLDFKELFYQASQFFSVGSLMLFFYISESILGLVPPELFIAWVKTLDAPIRFLSILALLSYLGGCTSYLIGYLLMRIPKLQQRTTNKLKQHLTHIRKWGGFLIVVGALLPVPFSMVSIAAGMIGYRLRSYLLFGLFRFLRFYLFAIAIFNLMG
ncbi:short-chain dehydrogenase [Prolixibacteraceae bacterium JC049]|nr:short-chain dehydrogenase [Prolixibacteraceae bacterium JC049]